AARRPYEQWVRQIVRYPDEPGAEDAAPVSGGTGAGAGPAGDGAAGACPADGSAGVAGTDRREAADPCPGAPASAPLPPLAAFGWTREELTVIVRPMVESGKEPDGSMGDDTPHAVLSLVHRPLHHYFRQRFAQVTNPPIDHLREALVFSLT